ncbi:MAG: hypothetical protein WDO06_09095 [Actinomycetota bacterium]
MKKLDIKGRLNRFLMMESMSTPTEIRQEQIIEIDGDEDDQS